MISTALLIDLHYLPCLEYFCLLLAHEKVYLEANESYIKGSYRNKAKIITANGLQVLSIPLSKGKHQQKRIQDVKIAEVNNWRSQHWKSLKTAYQSAPYWDNYEMDIRRLCLNSTSNLWSYNLQWLEGIIALLQLNISLAFTSSYKSIVENKIDYRHKILPKLDTYFSSSIQSVPYEQVFADRQSFIPNPCILDLLFCKGPESGLILEDMIVNK